MEQFPSQNLIMEPEKWMASLEKEIPVSGNLHGFRFHVKLGEGNPDLNGWLVQGFLSKESWMQGKMSRNQTKPPAVTVRDTYHWPHIGHWENFGGFFVQLPFVWQNKPKRKPYQSHIIDCTFIKN